MVYQNQVLEMIEKQATLVKLITVTRINKEYKSQIEGKKPVSATFPLPFLLRVEDWISGDANADSILFSGWKMEDRVVLGETAEKNLKY